MLFKVAYTSQELFKCSCVSAGTLGRWFPPHLPFQKNKYQYVFHSDPVGEGLVTLHIKPLRKMVPSKCLVTSNLTHFS